MNKLLRTLNKPSIRLLHPCQMSFCIEKVVQFSDVQHQQILEEKNIGVTNGRPWKANELRLKSNQDLHRLWYVMLKERNTCLSDNSLYNKVQNRAPKKARLLSIKQTMARLLTIVNERKKLRDSYRYTLEDAYVQQQRQTYLAKVQQNPQIEMPEIDQKLLAAKMRALKKGQDNTDYIQQALEIKQTKQQESESLYKKYDYQSKKVIDEQRGEEEEQQNPESIIRQFSSSVQKQLKANEPIKMSQQEILKSHVTNWGMLTIKQKRVILGFLNARRANESKQLFRQEIDLVRQKIQHDLKI